MPERARVGVPGSCAARCAAAALLLATIAAPALAEPCMGVTRNFGLCVAGTPWAHPEDDPAGRAGYDQFGDGMGLILDGLSLYPTEDLLAGDAVAPDATPAARLQADLALWEIDVLAEHGLETFDHAPLSFAAAYRTVLLYGDDAPSLQAVVAAAAGDRVVRLILHGPETMPLEDFQHRAREVAGLVRLQPEE